MPSIKDIVWIYCGYQRRALLIALRKPRIPAELRRELGLRLHSNLARNLNEFVSRGFVICLNPESNKGRLYQLTPMGIELRKILSNELGTTSEVKILFGIEPDLYSWVTRGKARRSIILAIKGTMTANAIRKAAEKYNKNLPRVNNFLTLNSLIKKGIVISRHDNKLRRLVYQLTSKGILIKDVLKY